ncbi:MAG: cytidylate kinase-like family protein [Lentimicrobiaceae bacterium]|nr:cytidylate kinase-like family protein [Lentimicrobiaceae bacterium]
MEPHSLYDYFERRHSSIFSAESRHPNPFITISREYGCPSKFVAHSLVEKLNLNSEGKNKWEYINKEIIADTANKINVNTEKIRKYFSDEEHNSFQDFLESFSSKYYINNKLIQKTIRNVVEFYALKGFCVIVGRGGVAITKSIPSGIHIRLQAPIDWRVEKICHTNNVSPAQAIKDIIEIDNKRNALIESFLRKKPDDILFDLVINCSCFSIDNISDLIIRAIEIKGLIK